MSIYTSFKWNIDNCIEGFWYEIEGSKFLLEPLSPFNVKWIESKSKNIKSLPLSQEDFFGISESKNKRSKIIKDNINFLLEFILKDWDVNDKEGKKLEFNKTNCLKLFDELPYLAYSLFMQSLLKGQEVEKEEKKN